MMKSAVLSFLLFEILLSYSLATRHEEDSCRSQWKNNDHTDSECNLTTKRSGDVYDNLWDQNVELANETLNTDFLIQMEKGSLDAFRFVQFIVQDILYLQVVTKMLKDVSEKAEQPEDLKTFLTKKYLSYEDFLDSCERQFSIVDPYSIEPTPAINEYLTTYKNVMDTETDTIYFAVALLPCSRLWVWVANTLKMENTNAYFKWKTDNMGGHPEKFRPFLNKYLNTPEKVQRANDIFHKQMMNERDFFSTS